MDTRHNASAARPTDHSTLLPSSVFSSPSVSSSLRVNQHNSYNRMQRNFPRSLLRKPSGRSHRTDSRSTASEGSVSSAGSFGDFSVENHTVDIAQILKSNGEGIAQRWDEEAQSLLHEQGVPQNEADLTSSTQSSYRRRSGQRDNSRTLRTLQNFTTELPSEDGGPEDFTENMEMWMRGTGPRQDRTEGTISSLIRGTKRYAKENDDVNSETDAAFAKNVVASLIDLPRKVAGSNSGESNPSPILHKAPELSDRKGSPLGKKRDQESLPTSSPVIAPASAHTLLYKMDEDKAAPNLNLISQTTQEELDQLRRELATCKKSLHEERQQRLSLLTEREAWADRRRGADLQADRIMSELDVEKQRTMQTEARLMETKKMLVTTQDEHNRVLQSAEAQTKELEDLKAGLAKRENQIRTCVDRIRELKVELGESRKNSEATTHRLQERHKAALKSVKDQHAEEVQRLRSSFEGAMQAQANNEEQLKRDHEVRLAESQENTKLSFEGRLKELERRLELVQNTATMPTTKSKEPSEIFPFSEEDKIRSAMNLLNHELRKVKDELAASNEENQRLQSQLNVAAASNSPHALNDTSKIPYSAGMGEPSAKASTVGIVDAFSQDSLSLEPDNLQWKFDILFKKYKDSRSEVRLLEDIISCMVRRRPASANTKQGLGENLAIATTHTSHDDMLTELLVNLPQIDSAQLGSGDEKDDCCRTIDVDVNRAIANSYPQSQRSRPSSRAAQAAGLRVTVQDETDQEHPPLAAEPALRKEVKPTADQKQSTKGQSYHHPQQACIHVDAAINEPRNQCPQDQAACCTVKRLLRETHDTLANIDSLKDTPKSYCCAVQYLLKQLHETLAEISPLQAAQADGVDPTIHNFLQQTQQTLENVHQVHLSSDMDAAMERVLQTAQKTLVAAQEVKAALAHTVAPALADITSITEHICPVCTGLPSHEREADRKASSFHPSVAMSHTQKPKPAAKKATAKGANKRKPLTERRNTNQRLAPKPKKGDFRGKTQFKSTDEQRLEALRHVYQVVKSNDVGF